MRKKQDIMWEQSTLWESVEKWVTKYLKKNHSEYRELQVKAMRIVEENPALRILINNMEGIVLTPEDHKALHKYIETKDEMTIFEYEYYYLAGQMMTFSYGRMLAQLVMNSYFVLRSNVLCNTSVNSVLHKYHKLVFTAIKLFQKSIILFEFL